MNEPAITINGCELSKGQAMTVRVALQSFIADLNANGLGDDDHGRMMTDAYLENANSINVIMRMTKT